MLTDISFIWPQSIMSGTALVYITIKMLHVYCTFVPQLLFGPQRCEGIGLSDGETMERLWYFLRRFGRMTKEMRPSHRVDVLSSALEYYGWKTKNKLGKLWYIHCEQK